MTRERLVTGARQLARRDRGLREILRRHGPPALAARPPGFDTLAQIVLEQQVSLASAGAAWARLRRRTGRTTPTAVVALGEIGLRQLGMTRQKARYLVVLADAVSSGALRLGQVGQLSDDDARATLTSLPGIGPWTADIYLLEALRRPDIWPVSDLALHRALQELRGRTQPFSRDELEQAGARWRPLRSVAVRMLWQEYLSRRNRLS